MKPIASPILAALLLAACETTPNGASPPPPMVYDSPAATTFSAEAFAWSQAQGSGSVLGSLGFRTAGARYSCLDSYVRLMPETAWSRRRMVILYGSAVSAAVPESIVWARTPSAPPGDYARFARRTSCDASGHFVFSGLPDGAWFVITVAKPIGDPAGEPIALIHRVETRGGPQSVNLN